MIIAGRAISRDAQPYVIAEIGVNHDGSPERALALTNAAAQAGAHAVKLQHFRADLLLSPAAHLATYQAAAGESDLFTMLQRLELPHSAAAAVVERAHALGMHAIVTVFSLEMVESAAALAWDAFKTASPDLINKPLISALAATGRPLIVSTGAAKLEEVRRAVAWLPASRSALLQCVSSYPAPEHDAALGGIRALAREFGLPTGYSDHTSATDTGALAVAAGACILEKHLTWSQSACGPDHAASLEPSQFAAYVAGVNRAWTMLGPERKELSDVEADVRRESRQSIVARRALRRGTTLSRDDLAIKRPGTGLPPWRLDDIIGRRLARDVEKDAPLVEADTTPTPSPTETAKAPAG